MQEDEDDCGSGHALGGFLRSLMAGIPWSESAERTETSTLASPRAGVLRVRNANGHIEITGEDRDDVEVEMAKRARAESKEAAERMVDAIRLVNTSRGDELDLEIEAPRRWNRRGVVNLTLRVPRALEVSCEAVNGKLVVHGLRAPVKARSSNGSVCVYDVQGDLEVHTSNAKVICRCTAGRLVARSSNGKVELEDHRGSIDASTSNGLIHVSVDELGAEGIRLATSNGRIVLELPDEVDADVDVRVDNGIIRNQRELKGGTRAREGKLIGVLGLGGTPIKIRTSNGSVSLR